MKSFFITLLAILSLSCFAQENYYIITSNSDLVFIENNNCSSTTVCNCGFYIQDIALTPNNKMYASSGKKIFEINLTDCSSSLITPTPVTDTFASSGQWINSLVALNDQFLFAVGTNAILYKIDIYSGTSEIIDTLIENIDGIEYWYGSGGDLTWYKGNLILVSALNELVEIKMNSSYDYINSINKIGQIHTPGQSIYGAITIGFADCEDDGLKLIGFEGSDVYSINPNNANADSLCHIALLGNAYGATSITETQNQIYEPNLKFPNIFTPNSDEINDHFIPIEFSGISTFEFSIMNRWGNLVYSSKEESINWDGSDNDKSIVDGVYFYIIYYSDYCGNNYKDSAAFTLLR